MKLRGGAVVGGTVVDPTVGAVLGGTATSGNALLDPFLGSDPLDVPFTGRIVGGGFEKSGSPGIAGPGDEGQMLEEAPGVGPDEIGGGG